MTGKAASLAECRYCGHIVVWIRYLRRPVERQTQEYYSGAQGIVLHRVGKVVAVRFAENVDPEPSRFYPFHTCQGARRAQRTADPVGARGMAW